jgi:hypothetical protein
VNSRQAFRVSFAATALLGSALAHSVLAAEYCVTCAGPAAMYACKIEGVAADAPSDPRAQLLCIQELARQGAHETCSVPRSAPKPCPGVMRVVAAPAGLSTTATNEAGAAQPQPESGAPAVEATALEEPAVKDEKPAKEPRTVEELASQTVDASKNGLKKAGEAVSGTAEKAGDSVGQAGSAVGSAAKKTWDCLKSLFSAC